MLHLGLMVKEWRALRRTLMHTLSNIPDPSSTSTLTSPKEQCELEWRWGEMKNGSFTPSLQALDFQLLVRRLTAIFQIHQQMSAAEAIVGAAQTATATATAIAAASGTASATASGTSNNTSTSTPPPSTAKTHKPIVTDAKIGSAPATATPSMAPAAAAPSISALLGRIARVEEWHIEDLLYEGGIRARHAKLASVLSNKSKSSHDSSKSSHDSSKSSHDLSKESAKEVGIKEYVQKQRVVWSDMRALQRKYDGRFSLKYERPISPSTIAHIPLLQRRLQTRRSFWIGKFAMENPSDLDRRGVSVANVGKFAKSGNDFGKSGNDCENFMRIDLSIVQLFVQQQPHGKTSSSSSSSSSSSQPPVITYECEIEILAEGAETMSDAKLVGYLYNWILEINDLFGKITGSEVVDGSLLVVRTLGESSNTAIPTMVPSAVNPNLVPSPPIGAAASVKIPTRAICSDTLLMPVNRELCRPIAGSG
jgi:hypothetical protein